MKNGVKGTVRLVLICLFMSVLYSCENGFDENEFLEKQAELAETKAQLDHQRAMELIDAQLQATLSAMQAQAGYDQELLALQAMIAEELEKLKASLKVKEDSTSAANILQAYRNAGLINEYRVRFENSGEAIEGVTASISGRSEVVLSNQHGEAVFEDVIVGVNVLSISSEDYLDVNLNLMFNPRTVITVGSTAVVIPSYSSSVVNLLKSGNNLQASALVKGKISIETDLTNDSPELLANENLEVYVDFDAATAKELLVLSEESVTTMSFNFTEGNLGRATMDYQAGTYEMYLPVEGSAKYELNVSELTVDQRIASKDGYLSVPTLFSAGSLAADDIPEVNGVTIGTSTSPSAQGSGVSFTYTPVPRSLGTILITTEGPVEQKNTTFWIKNEGNGYRTSPVILNNEDVSVGFGAMKGYVESLTVNNVGQNFSHASLIISVQGVTSNNNPFDVEIIDFELDIVNGSIPAKIQVPSDLEGSGIDNMIDIFNGKITGFTASVLGDGSGANVDVTMNLRVFGLVIIDPTEYSETPTYTFVHQGNDKPSEIATLNVSNFKRFFNIEIDNSGIVTPYNTTPEILELLLENSLSTHVIQYTGLGQSNVDINEVIRLNGQGGLRFNKAGVYTTLEMFVNEPVINEVSRPSEAYTFTWEVNDQGGIHNVQLDNQGSGYSELFDVVVSPRFDTAPGANAMINSAVDFNEYTGEYLLDMFELANSGSGYLINLNRAVKDNGFGNGVILNVKPGETKVVDIRLGTGVRLDIVEGDQ